MKGRKKVIKRKDYKLTILSKRTLLAPVFFVTFLPFALIHELTHVLALKRGMSEKWICLLPMVTELPFLSITILSFFFSIPFIIFIFCTLFGLVGLCSFDGDFQTFLSYRKESKFVPNLSFIEMEVSC